VEEEPDFGQPIGKQLRLLRLRRDLSLRALADASGIAASEISRLERGRDARWSTIARLLDALAYEVRLDVQETCDEFAGVLQDEMETRRERQREGPGGVLPKRRFGQF
jgi:transcriptional regulator with XRE-family HTH domain